jgi:hypothetical protein
LRHGGCLGGGGLRVGSCQRRGHLSSTNTRK